jgi:hypothetical protein
MRAYRVYHRTLSVQSNQDVMTGTMRNAAGVIAVIVLAVGSTIAYQRYTQRSHVVNLVRDAGVRLTAAIQAEASGAPIPDAEANARAAEDHVNTLRRMNTSSFAPLADGADDYLVTAREILKRALEAQRARDRVAADLEALRTHLSTDRGVADWTQEAVRLKQALDADSRDYRIAVDSYSTLLQSLPQAQARVTPFVEDVPLVDGEVAAQAGRHALDALAAADQNIRQVASLDAYRGR